MIRLLLTVLLLLCPGFSILGLSTLGPGPARAQSTAAAPAPAPAPAVVDARRALDVLKDDRRRADLIKTLETIIAAQGTASVTRPASAAPTPAPTPAPAPNAAPAQDGKTEPVAAPNLVIPLAIPLAPDSLGANLLLGVTELTNRLGERFRESALLMMDLPRLVSWGWTMGTDPTSRALLMDGAWRLGLVFAIGLGAMWFVRLLLRRPRASLIARAPRVTPAAAAAGIARAEEGETEGSAPPPADTSLWRRLPFVLGALMLELLTVIAFLVSTQVVSTTPIGGSLLMQLMLLALLHGFALWRAVQCLGAAVTAPDVPSLRLLPVTDHSAAYLQRRLCWLSGLVIMGDALARVSWLLGMSAAAHAAIDQTILWVAHLGLAVIVVHERAAVAAWLAAVETPAGAPVPLRARLAPIWHWIACAIIAVLYGMLMLKQASGPIEVLSLLLSSLGVLVLARFAGVTAARLLDRLNVPPGDRTANATGTLEHGLHAWLRVGVRVVIFAVAVLALLQVWGLPALAWLFATALGRQILSSLGTIVVTLAVAISIWELANLAVGRHLAQLQAQARTGKAARLRTLLPMLRTILFVGILITVGLTVLSQLGVNIAPLLAGAGVLGIAIGFGSQKLVQDVITGLFLLLENVMQVGDVVTLGGLTGTVEELSVRSIRLRAEDGSVHVIPFSAVTTVTNMTRDFGHAVIEARVAITEDFERVVQVLHDAFEAMRAEPLWQTDIVGDLDMQGLARMDDTAMVIKCRLRCGPFARARVLREFQRRIQQSFANAGVALPGAATTPAPAAR